MNYRTPLGSAKGLGAARTGSRHWWWQRASALAMIPLTFWLVAAVLQLPRASYEAIVGWIQAPWNTLLLVAFTGLAFFHAMLGLQVIIEDYVHTDWLRTGGILGVKLLCFLLTLAAVLAILRIAFMH